MKKSKIIIPAAAMLLFSTAAAVSGTVAWFTASKTVNVTNMKVKAKAEGSLVIADSVNSLKSSTKSSINYTDAEKELYASTHNDGWDGTNIYTSVDKTTTATCTSGLKYILNSENISPDSGLAYTSADSSAIVYGNAENDTSVTGKEKYFYVDHKVYIASSGDVIEGQKIKIELSEATAQTGINAAMSIDFYAAFGTTEVVASDSSFVGTLNRAHLDESTNDGTTCDKIYAFETSGINIAVNKDVETSGYVSILMRIYFDGELKNTVVSKSTDTFILESASGTATEDTNVYDNRGGLLKTVTSGSALSNYLLNTAFDTTFAKNVDAANIGSVALGVKFTAETK